MVDEYDETSVKIYDCLKLLDPSQDHKYVILEEIEKLIFGEKKKKKEIPYMYMSDDQIEFLLLGSESPSFDDLSAAIKAAPDEDLRGLVQICEVKVGVFTWRKSKRSSELALKIIHRMITDGDYKLRSTVQRTFSGFSLDVYKQMDLGRHYWNFVNGNLRMKAKENVALEIIKFIKQRRLKDIFPLSTIIKKEKYEERINGELAALAKKPIERRKSEAGQPDESEGSESVSESLSDSDGDKSPEEEKVDTSIDKKRKPRKKGKAVLNDWGKQPTAWSLVDKDDRANFTLVKN